MDKEDKMQEKSMKASGGEIPGKADAKVGFFEYYEVTVQLIKAIIWPAVVIFLFISFQAPLKATVEQLPSVFTRTRAINLAGVSLEIDRQLYAETNP